MRTILTRKARAQASGQFSKLETKPKTAFLAAKKRPRMTKRWHRLEKRVFLHLLKKHNDETILPRQAQDKREEETTITYQDRLGMSTRMNSHLTDAVRKKRFFGAIYFTYENDRFAKIDSGQTYDGKIETRDALFAETLTDRRP
jgi:hypothetical protein